MAKPKSRDRERTRDKILAAARKSFATRGYAESGMREIAAVAGINQALVVRYFGSKKKLFLAAVEPDLGLAEFINAPRAQIGEHIVRHLADKQPHEAEPLAILLLAATDPSLAPTLRRLIADRLYDPLVTWLGGKNAPTRAALLLALFSGAWMYRQMLPVPPLATLDRPTAARLAADIQALVDG
jgi:AcrR family transcriptional regulator